MFVVGSCHFNNSLIASHCCSEEEIDVYAHVSITPVHFKSLLEVSHCLLDECLCIQPFCCHRHSSVYKTMCTGIVDMDIYDVQIKGIIASVVENTIKSTVEYAIYYFMNIDTVVIDFKLWSFHSK